MIIFEEKLKLEPLLIFSGVFRKISSLFYEKTIDEWEHIKIECKIYFRFFLEKSIPKFNERIIKNEWKHAYSSSIFSFDSVFD